MAKTATLYARIEPKLKSEAEGILSDLGVSVSSAINMFYRQIVMQRGLPFNVRKAIARPVDISTLGKAEFDALLQKGLDSLAAGRRMSLAQVRRAVEAELADCAV